VCDGASQGSRTSAGLLHPEVAHVLDDFYRFNTVEARSAFAGSWLSILAKRLDRTWPCVYELLELVRAQELYRRDDFLYSKQTYPTFEAFFTDVLGQPFTTWADLEATYHFVEKVKPVLFGATFSEANDELYKHGRPSKGQEKRSNRTIIKRGVNSQYLRARLKRDCPDILQALDRGEFPSVRQAAIAAGIVKVPTLLDQAVKLWQRMSGAERQKFLKRIKDD